MKKLFVLLGALVLTFTLATAEGKCGNGQKGEMKCSSGKCAGDKNQTKEAPSKGKCGQGKCG